MKLTLSAIIALIAAVMLAAAGLGFAYPSGWDPGAIAVSLFIVAVAVHWSGR